MASTMAAAEEALYDLLTANLDDVQVIYGPRGALVLADVVSIDDIEFQHQASSMGDARDVEEVYDILLTISSGQPNTTAQREVTERALGIFADVEALLEPVTQTLGVAGVLSVMVRGFGRVVKHREPEVVTKGRCTSVSCRVNVRAYI
jgi:hypothetical protein